MKKEKLGSIKKTKIGTDLGRYIYTKANKIYVQDELPLIKTRGDFALTYGQAIIDTQDCLWELLDRVIRLGGKEIYVLSGAIKELVKVNDIKVVNAKDGSTDNQFKMVRINGSYDLEPLSIYTWRGNHLEKIHEISDKDFENYDNRELVVLKPKLFIMSGVAGSGKSERAKMLSQKYDATIVSSDIVRKELFGENYVYDSKDNKEVFEEVERRLKELGSKGNNAIFDATNLQYKYRKLEYEKYKDLFHVVIYQIRVELEELFARNAEREESKQVPYEVISNMVDQLQHPITEHDCDEYIVETILTSRGVKK